MSGVSNRQFAVLDGCTETRVRRGRNRGELAVLPDGTLDPKLAGTGWRAGNREALSPAGGEHTVPAGVRTTETLADALRRRQIGLARLRRHEWHRRSAEWVLSHDAELGWRAVVDDVTRGILDSIPHLAAAAGQCTAIHQMAAAIHGVVYATLVTVAGAPPDGVVSNAGDDLPDIDDTATLLEAEIAKLSAAAALVQLNVDIAKGVVVKSSVVAKALGTVLSRVRQRSLDLQATLPPRLWGSPKATWEAKIREVLLENLAELQAGWPVSLPATGDGKTDVATANEPGGGQTRGRGPRAGAAMAGGRNTTRRKPASREPG